MRAFAALYAELDATTATNAKLDALARYFRQAPAEDAAWAVYFLSGGKPRQVVPTQVMYGLACERAGIEPWLFDLSYEAVGDFAETVAHVLPAPSRRSELGLAAWVTERLLPLRGADPAIQRERIAQYWDELGRDERFVMNKLITGELRVGVSKLLVGSAIAAMLMIGGTVYALSAGGVFEATPQVSSEAASSKPAAAVLPSAAMCNSGACLLTLVSAPSTYPKLTSSHFWPKKVSAGSRHV